MIEERDAADLKSLALPEVEKKLGSSPDGLGRTEAGVIDQDGNEFKVTKGAPQVILELSSNSKQVLRSIRRPRLC